jgi:hypothetical protein
VRAVRDLAIIFAAAIALQAVVTSCRPTHEPPLHAVEKTPASCTNYEKGDRILIDHEEMEVVEVTVGRLVVKRRPDAVAHAADVTLLCLPAFPWPPKP